MLAARLAVAVALCLHFLTAVLVVGWTARWMARNIRRGWWRRGPARDAIPWPDFAAEQGHASAAGLSPRWLVHERAVAVWDAPAPDGRPPGPLRRMARLPRVLLGGLAANLRAGLTILLATFIVTAPGAFLMLAGWQYGWDISFHKVYEQAFIGRVTFLIGMFATLAAFLYLPLAIPHLAISGRLRDFFQVRLIRALARNARLGLVVHAAAVVLLGTPAYIGWLRIYGLTNEPQFAWLQDATADQVIAFRDGYARNMTLLVAPAYLLVHLLAAAVYRRALLTCLAREPRSIDDLPPRILAPLERLELIPAPSTRRRMLLVRAVLGTARRGTSIVLWWAHLALWLALLLQMIVANFFHAHPFLIWFNPWLLGLPCPRWFASW
jgi:hypothetical protein